MMDLFIEKGLSGIYILQSLSDTSRIYVVSSNDLRRRRNRHFSYLRRNKHENPKLQRHYNKYGEDDLVFEVIESGDYFNKQHLLSREQGWYSHFRCNNIEIPYFNICKIAGSNSGLERTQSWLDNLNKSLRGKNAGEKHFNFGKHLSQETKDNISKGELGKIVSTEGRINISNGQKGIRQSKETIDKRATSLKKPILRFNRQGEFIDEWPSAVEAAFAMGIRQTGISACLRGIKPSAANYIWKYKIL
jgi:group I intron endonuclease